jgi:hypothetical protein
MKKIIYVCVILSLIGLSGCQTNSKMDVINGGLPKQQYLVGGGFTIEYTAPCDGIAYVVEKNSNKIAQTKSLEKGERFMQQAATLDEENSKRLYNQSVSELRFQLYFVPSDKIETPSDKPCK